MDAKLPQKTEELTLYTIQQEKKLDEQAEQIRSLAEQHQTILNEIQKLTK